MKYLKITLVVLIVLIASCTGNKYQTKSRVDSNGYKYQEVTNDPFKARIYTLSNGFTVYLTRNLERPRIAALIGVRAGSVNEDPEFTGLAHYLEHMMFKGTSKIGTVNWEEESVLLELISDLFEKHRITDNPAEKREIYAEIDRLSQIAATYVATNEFDKIVTSMGATMVNAGTSYEKTVYMCEVPKNEIEKWAILESERFSDLVLRLFHTELETIYEEFNMYQDYDEERAFNALMKGLFPNHPYGRDVVGFPEHLKNPSMKQIYEFLHKYYVPSNMAIVLSGDFEFEPTIQLIDKYFGHFESGEKHTIVQPREEPILSPVELEVSGPETEYLRIAYRFDGGAGTKDDLFVSLISSILTNYQAGLIDLNIVQAQKALEASSYSYALKDYTINFLDGTPRDGQTLEEVRDLILNEIENVKNGNFDDWLIEAIVNDYRIGFMRRLENSFYSAYTLMNYFTDEIPLEKALNQLDEMAKITKKEIMEFAKNNYNDNYVIVYKRTGESTGLVKVDKPEISTIPVNRDLQSDFAKEILAMEISNIEPVFVDFDKNLNRKEIKPGVTLYHTKNETNELFSLNYIVDMGRNHNLLLPLAIDYLPLIGTDKYSPQDLQKEFYRHGLSFNVNSGFDRCYVSISGLASKFETAIELLEHVLNNAKPDQEIYEEYVKSIEKTRADEKMQQNYIFSAMIDYGFYGKKSPKKNLLSIDEMNQIEPVTLTDLLAQMTSYEHKINYFGTLPIDNVVSILNKYNSIPDKLTELPQKIDFQLVSYEKPIVFLIDYDISQANVYMFAKDQIFDKAIMPYSAVFNNFYGSGLSSVVYQEIRESRALAYAASSFYINATEKDKYNAFYVYLGTQPDKLKEAASALLELMNKMPRAETQFNQAIEGIIKKTDTERITGRNLFWTYLTNKDRGIDYDIRKDIYAAVKEMTIDDFENFFNSNISNKNYGYMILGNIKSMDQKVLAKLGEIKILSLEDVFGY